MEKTIHHEEKPKRPIGCKRSPHGVTDYDPGPQVIAHLRRLGLHKDYYDNI